MKKLLVLFLTVVLLGTMFVGCQKKTTEKQSTDTTTVQDKKTDQAPKEVDKFIYVRPGGPAPDHEKVMDAVNKKMAADGIGIELEILFIPWDAWQQKVNIMLSAGEQIDLLNIMNDWIPLSTYAGTGALQDIEQLVDEYGPNIKKYNPDIMLNAGKVGGKSYAMPAFWVEFSRDPSITVRKDLLDQYGLAIPKTADDVINIYDTIMKNWKGNKKPYLTLAGQNMQAFNLGWRTYDTWPFVVNDGVFYVNQDGTVKSYFETDEFKKDCELANALYKKGIIDPDILVKKNEDINNQIKSGDWITSFGTGGNGDIETIKTNYPNLKKDELVHVLLAPEKVNLRPFGTRNMNAVPVTAKHPEAGVKFINWLYTSQENYDLYCYGIEGVHYNKIGDKQYEPILNASGSKDYSASVWGIGNLAFSRTTTVESPSCIRDLYTIDEAAENSISASFVFDATNVATELANVRTEAQTSIVPLLAGVIAYEEGYEVALSKLKKAGLDTVMTEYKKQFEAYRASIGK